MYPFLWGGGEEQLPLWMIKKGATARNLFQCTGSEHQFCEALTWIRDHIGQGGPDTWQYNPHPSKRWIWFHDDNAAFAFKMRWL